MSSGLGPNRGLWDAGGDGGGYSLGCRVVQLVLAGPGEAALHAAVGPQPLDDSGQVVWQDALLLRRCRQGKQLAGVVLEKTWRQV